MDAIAPRFPPQSLLLTFACRKRPEPDPAVLLGMPCIDEHYWGLGAQLLRDAILNSLKVSELAGARALVVDPAGETCQKSGGFHRLEKGLRSGRRDA